jgi:hypothetical protein
LARPRRHEWNLRARNYLLFAASGHDPESAEVSPLDEP